MGRTACTEPQCLYKGDLYLTYETEETHRENFLVVNPKQNWYAWVLGVDRKVQETRDTEDGPRMLKCEATEIEIYQSLSLNPLNAELNSQETHWHIIRHIPPTIICCLINCTAVSCMWPSDRKLWYFFNNYQSNIKFKSTCYFALFWVGFF
jgi:hypothetical protein